MSKLNQAYSRSGRRLLLNCPPEQSPASEDRKQTKQETVAELLARKGVRPRSFGVPGSVLDRRDGEA